MSASLSFRAASSPAFYVHALTTTTNAERWPLTACAAIASNDYICLPPTRGAHASLINGGAHLHCGQIAAAPTRVPTLIRESPAATELVDNQLGRVLDTLTARLQSHLGPLPVLAPHRQRSSTAPTSLLLVYHPFAYHWCWPTTGTYLRRATPSRVPQQPLSPRRISTARAASPPSTLLAPIGSWLPKTKPTTINRTGSVRAPRHFLATTPRIPSRFPLAVPTPATQRHSLKPCKPLA
jgi:hypothetical protein